MNLDVGNEVGGMMYVSGHNVRGFGFCIVAKNSSEYKYITKLAFRFRGNYELVELLRAVDNSLTFHISSRSGFQSLSLVAEA